MIYLDNAATSYPKPDRVYDEMLLCMKEYCANPGRSGHELAIKREGRCMKPGKLCQDFSISKIL